LEKYVELVNQALRLELGLHAPTAVQSVVATQETLFKTEVRAPAGSGMCWIVQLEPSHNVATAVILAAPLLSSMSPLPPTAMHMSLDGHETPARLLQPGFGGAPLLLDGFGTD
jgi:hypothetical protein